MHEEESVTYPESTEKEKSTWAKKLHVYLQITSELLGTVKVT